MQDPQTLQSYLNNFRRHLARYLQPGVGVSANVYPTKGPGAIIEITLGPQQPNTDQFEPPVMVLGDALLQVKQRAFGGNLAAVSFGGTNVILEDNRIILIKGEDDPPQWDDKATVNDVKRVVHGRGRSMKIGKVEATPKEIRDIFKDDHSAIYQFLGAPTDINRWWLLGPISLLVLCLTILVFGQPLNQHFQVAIVVAALGAATWLCLLVHEIFESSTSTLIVAIGSLFVLGIAAGVLTLGQAIEQVEKMKK